MTRRERPLSPFLVYRFDYTMVLSFSHRVTGVLLAIGALVLASCLVALACGPTHYARVMGILDSWLFKLLLLCWLFSFSFHIANGIRHLAWDLGYGFEKSTARMSGWIVLIAALVLTAGSVWMALGRHGGVP